MLLWTEHKRLCLQMHQERLKNIGVENLLIVWKVKHGKACPGRLWISIHLLNRSGKYIYDLVWREYLTFLLNLIFVWQCDCMVWPVNILRISVSYRCFFFFLKSWSPSIKPALYFDTWKYLSIVISLGRRNHQN